MSPAEAAEFHEYRDGKPVGFFVPAGGGRTLKDPFRFARAGSLSSALRDAGFEGEEDEIRSVPWLWPGEPEEVWEYAQAVSAPFRGLLGRVPAEKWPAVNAEVHAAIRKYTREGGIHFGAEIVFAAGEKK